MSAAATLPGSAVGLLGAGELGRMIAIAARRMGYRVHTFSPDSGTPAGLLSDVAIMGSYDDLDAVREFARGVSVVTFASGDVPVAAAEAAAEFAPVRPAPSVLETTRQRLREKTFLKNAGLPHVPFQPVDSRADLDRALAELGAPAVLKTAAAGSEGPGLYWLASPADAGAAWQAMGEREAVLEAQVDFYCELSVVAARDQLGNFVHYGVVENRHRNHHLDTTIAPARVDQRVTPQAVAITRAICEQLGVVGVMCVEFFLTDDGKLLVDELAPRPHNSGHFTIDASVTSQFEQQLRAVSNLPLGSTELLRPAVMVNLAGDLWAEGEPNWPRAMAFPNVKLHLYGQREPRPGRKMGHLTALGGTREQALGAALHARESLKPRPGDIPARPA